MNRELIAILEYLEREKGIKRQAILDAIEESLRVAARKSIQGSSNVSVSINPKTGQINVFSEKHIVEKVTQPSLEISLVAAQEIDPECRLGQYIDVLCTPKDFGRIAAQKAKQVITQKLRSAERDVIYEEYRHRIGELISGSVKRFVRGLNMIIDMGKVEAVLPMSHYPKTEHYNVGDKVFALIHEVRDTDNEGAEVVLTRSHPEFVVKLLRQEVPELEDGTISIRKIVREAGYRTKIAVSSSDMKVDPVGACVGMRGNRIKNIIRELNNEKIDIFPYSDNELELLQNALAPSEIRKIRHEEGLYSIVVDDEAYPAVIGKKGMNARLTGKLLDSVLEVQRMSEYNRMMALQRAQLIESEDPSLDEPISEIEGIHPLIIENLLSEGLNTPRKLLAASLEDLTAIPGVSMDTADRILQQIWKQGV